MFHLTIKIMNSVVNEKNVILNSILVIVAIKYRVIAECAHSTLFNLTDRKIFIILN